MSANRPGIPSSAASPPGGEPSGDPWAAFGYMVAGVLFYGVVGFGLDVWLHVSFLLPIGIVVGAGFGIFMVFARYRYRGEDAKAPSSQSPIDHDRPHERPAGDDRGEK